MKYCLLALVISSFAPALGYARIHMSRASLQAQNQVPDNSQSPTFPVPPPPPPDQNEPSVAVPPIPSPDQGEAPDQAPSMDNSGAAQPDMDQSGSAGGDDQSSSGSDQTQVPQVISSGKKGSGMSMANAGPEDITNKNFPDLIESFDYPNADIRDVIRAISQLTHKDFIIDNNVSGKITIIAPTRITVAEAYKAFLSALAINHLTVVPDGKFLRITRSMDARQGNIQTYSGAYYPTADVMITRIIPLKYANGEDVMKVIQPMKSPDGDLQYDSQQNSLIISDYGSNIQRISRIVDQLDKPGYQQRLAVIRIHYAKAKDIANIITQIINKDNGAATSPYGFVRPPFVHPPGQGGAQQELSVVTPDERTNSIIVLGTDAGIAKVKSVVRKLDFPINPEDAGGVFVYYVRYADATKLADVLNGIAANAKAKTKQAGPRPYPGFIPPMPYGQSPTSGETGSFFGGNVKVSADKLTNSLIITASKQDYEVVKSILAKLDIPREQAFIEATIMEMSAQKKNIWSLNYYKFVPNPDGSPSQGAARTGFGDGNLADVLNPGSTNPGAILEFGNGNNMQLQIPGTTNTITIPSLVAFLKFVTTHTNADILSNPRILAMNNEKATIEVGDEVPVSMSQVTTTVGTTLTPQFKKAEIKLVVTPFISPQDNTVRMKIEQIVSQISSQQSQVPALANNTQSLSTRSIKTNIVVPSGDTAVLGGLVKNMDETQISKVPILGDIPILGWLFKSETVQHDRNNLVVFITPTIIRNVGNSHQILDSALHQRINFVKENYRGVDPFGRKADKLPRVSDSSESMSTGTGGASENNSPSDTEDVIQHTMQNE